MIFILRAPCAHPRGWIRVFASTWRVSLDTPPTLLSIFGGKNLDSEQQLSFGLGYRSAPRLVLLLDVAIFYNRYGKIVWRW